MSLIQILPIVAAITVVAITVTIAFHQSRAPIKTIWILPAILMCLFLGWTLVAVISEGPIGFWTEHTRNLWGNQIWFDLLLAAGTAWALIAPRAKAQQMLLLPWLGLILATGSIGILAMVARLLFLEERMATSA
jgi:hypothetical protein